MCPRNPTPLSGAAKPHGTAADSAQRSETLKSKGTLQHAVPKKMLVHIGDMAVSFALVELHLKMLIGSLIREHQAIGQIISAQLSFARLRALAKALYVERHGKDKDYVVLEALVKRAADWAGKRDQITHSFWGAGKSADVVTRVKITVREEKGFRCSSKEYSAGKLEDLARDLKTLAHDFMRFHMDLMSRGKAINNPGKKIW